MNKSNLSQPRKAKSTNGRKSQQGYTLISVLVLLTIVLVMANSMINMSESTQKVSSASIQRDRVFQSIDSALAVGENYVKKLSIDRVFSDTSASEGLFSQGSRPDRWWKDTVSDGERLVDTGLILGVSSPPVFASEQIGNYISDGGTGIVNLGTGSGDYGRLSNGSREVVLYSIEAYGKGSNDDIQAAAESTLALTR